MSIVEAVYELKKPENTKVEFDGKFISVIRKKARDFPNWGYSPVAVETFIRFLKRKNPTLLVQALFQLLDRIKDPSAVNRQWLNHLMPNGYPLSIKSNFTQKIIRLENPKNSYVVLLDENDAKEMIAELVKTTIESKVTWN